ncbi:MAG: hypothetical protein IE885_00670 [Campylobacterales bacterium]|nr:hypothetical protein [Campylobacterales bacterium]
MKYLNLYNISLTAILSLLATACAPSTVPPKAGGYYYNGIYFGQNLDENYRHGIKDGCRTAQGEYTKSHRLFNNNQSYEDGWFLGRNKCRLK